MRQKKLGLTLLCGLVAAVSLAGCGGSDKPLTAAQLASRIIEAPINWAVDPTAGASGQISPQLFSQFGGTGQTASTGFVAGFKQNYIDSGTLEGLSVTVLEFRTKAQASEYFNRTLHQTLSFANATYSPDSAEPGAIEASGTKTYAGNYVHGVVDTTGRYYLQLVYEDPVSSAVPVELKAWFQIQWALLQPGVKVQVPTTT